MLFIKLTIKLINIVQNNIISSLNKSYGIPNMVNIYMTINDYE